MNSVQYAMTRWRLSAERRDGCEAFAVDALYGEIQRWVPYILTLERPDVIAPAETDGHLAVIGTLRHPVIREAVEAGWLEAESHSEGYSIRLGDSPFQQGKKLLIIQGADDKGILNGAMDLIHFYVHEQRYRGYHYSGRFVPFLDDMPDFLRREAPQIERRGIWMWGHAMYDYRAFFENMARFKLNTITIWNDHAPVNGADMVRCAHSLGIRVIWGYSWGWGEAVDPNDAAQRNKWENFAVETYRREYRELGGDGIYFQMFTETNEQEIGGRPISELCVEWTNQISGRMLREFPGLEIQFGVHATSIRERCGDLASVLSQVRIVWEDVGSFPYHYDPRVQQDCEAAVEYTRKIASLRGGEERFGAVLKGYQVLNWSQFEHQLGHVLNGVSNAVSRRERDQIAAFTWRFALPYWMLNASKLQRVIRTMRDGSAADRDVTMLCEQGMLEKGVRLPVALTAELLWNADQEVDALLTLLCHSEDVFFE